MSTPPFRTNPDQRVVAVLGMHRSGTSALTRSLQVLGVRLGDELIAAQADNTKGFWEDAAIVQLNKDMMAHLGRHWYSVTPVTQPQTDELIDSAFFQRATELLAQRLNTFTVFGFKDPRVAMLVHFWQAVFDAAGLKTTRDKATSQVSYLLSIRHPLSVAQSLAKRNDMPARHAHWLWLNHTLASLQATEGKQRVLVDYDELMAQPAHQLQRLSDALGMPVDAQALQEFETGFLDPAMRHAAFDEQALANAPDCPPLIREVYPALLSVARGNTDLNDPRLLEQTRQWVSALHAEADTLALADHWLDLHEKDQQALRNEQQALRREQQRQVKQQRKLQQALDESHRQAAKRAAEHKDYVGKIHHAQQATTQRHEQWQAASDKKLQAAQSQVRELQETLQRKTAELEEIESSQSWRVTRPIRFARRLLIDRPRHWLSRLLSR